MNRRNRGESLLWMWSISMAIGGFCWFFQWEGSLSAVEDEGRLNSNLDMHINLRQRLALTSMTSFMTNISIFFFNRSKVWGISPKLTWTCQIGYPSLSQFWLKDITSLSSYWLHAQNLQVQEAKPSQEKYAATNYLTWPLVFSICPLYKTGGDQSWHPIKV